MTGSWTPAGLSWRNPARCPPLTNLEDPQYRGTITVSTDTYTIASADLDYMVHTLAILRTSRTMMAWQLWRTSRPASGSGGAEVAAPQGCPVVVASAEPNELDCQDGLFAKEVTPEGFGSRCGVGT